MDFLPQGADISWYINGQFVQEEEASGYDQSLSGYSVASPGFTAPESGIVTVSVKSQNQLDVSAVVASTGSEPGAGSVSVTGVTCGNSPYYNCSCESNEELIIYFSKRVQHQGSGVAYVDVFIDGNLAVSNNPTSTTTGGEEVIDSVAIPCPNQNSDHTILVRGKNGDIGASTVLSHSTPLGGGVGLGTVLPGYTSNPLSGTSPGSVTARVVVPTGNIFSPRSTVVPSVSQQVVSGVDVGTVAIVGGALAISAILLYAAIRKE